MQLAAGTDPKRQIAVSSRTPSRLLLIFLLSIMAFAQQWDPVSVRDTAARNAREISN
jgi:hypothetical protein